MISPEEEKFYAQWEKERLQPHYKRRPFLRGLSVGLSLGVLILVITEFDWYERANMQVNSRGNENLINIAILIITLGIGWFYQQFTSEMNEQRYQELKHIKSKK
jgi:hypothetical protein